MICRTCRFDRLDRNRCRGLEDVSDRASTSTSTSTPQRRVQATVQLLLRTSNSNFQGSWLFVKRWVFFVKCTTRTSNDIAERKTGLFLLFFYMYLAPDLLRFFAQTHDRLCFKHAMSKENTHVSQKNPLLMDSKYVSSRIDYTTLALAKVMFGTNETPDLLAAILPDRFSKQPTYIRQRILHGVYGHKATDFARRLRSQSVLDTRRAQTHAQTEASSQTDIDASERAMQDLLMEEDATSARPTPASASTSASKCRSKRTVVCL